MSVYYLLLAITPFHTDPRVGAALFTTEIAIFTPAKIVGLLAVVAALFARPAEHAAQRQRSSIPALFILFAAIPLIVAFSADLPTPTENISRLLSVALLYAATRRLVTTPGRMVKSARTLVLAFAFSSLWVYKQTFFLGDVAPPGVEGDSNYEALMLLIAIPLAFWMMRYESGARYRRLGLGCALMLIGALTLTESRAGIIAGGVMGLLGALRTRRRLRNVALLAAGAVLLAIVGPADLHERFRSINLTGVPINGAEQSTRIHVELLKAGLSMMAHHPLLGVGLNQFKPNASKYNAALAKVTNSNWIAHDTFVQIGAECGIPVLVLFFAMLGVTLRNFRRARRGAEPSLAALGLAMEIGLLGISLAALSITEQFLSFGLLISLSPNLRELAAAGAARLANSQSGPSAITPAHRTHRATG